MDELKDTLRKEIQKQFGSRMSEADVDEIYNRAAGFGILIQQIILNNHGYCSNHFLNCDECFAQLGTESIFESKLTKKLFEEKVVSEALIKIHADLKKKNFTSRVFADGYMTARKNIESALKIYLKEELSELRRPTLAKKIYAKLITLPLMKKLI